MLKRAYYILVILSLLYFDNSSIWYSMFLLICLLIHLQILEGNFCEETMLKLLLLLYVNWVFLSIFPFWDPKWWLNCRFLLWQEAHYPKTTWVHIFTVDGRWILCKNLFVWHPIESFSCLWILRLFSFLIWKHQVLLLFQDGFCFWQFIFFFLYLWLWFFLFILRWLDLFPILHLKHILKLIFRRHFLLKAICRQHYQEQHW